MVDIYMELHAPPEHIVNGIDKLEKMFSKICLTWSSWPGLSGSIKLKNAYAINASNKI